MTLAEAPAMAFHGFPNAVPATDGVRATTYA